MGQEVGGSYGGGVTQGVGGGGGLHGADGEANPQPPAAVRCHCSRLLLGLHVGVRRKVGCCLVVFLWGRAANGGGPIVLWRRKGRREKEGEGGEGGMTALLSI